jgi:hypothetical protein
MVIDSFIKKMFPEVWHNKDEPIKQLLRIRDEYEELEQAIFCDEGKKQILREGIDVIHATFNTLYKFGFSDIDIYKTIIEVKNNNSSRGYYKINLEVNENGEIRK